MELSLVWVKELVAANRRREEQAETPEFKNYFRGKVEAYEFIAEELEFGKKVKEVKGEHNKEL